MKIYKEPRSKNQRKVTILSFDVGLDGGKTKAMSELAAALVPFFDVTLTSIREPSSRRFPLPSGVHEDIICPRNTARGATDYELYDWKISVPMSQRIESYLKSLDADVLYCPNYDSKLYYQLRQLVPRTTKLIVGDHGSRRYGSIEKVVASRFHTGETDKYFGYAAASFDAVHVINPLVVDQYRSVSPNVFFIPNTVTTKAAPASRERAKEIVMVGRLEDVKCHELGIEAFTQLVEEFPEWTLLIYGQGSHEESLRGLIEKLGASAQVHLKGFTENIDAVYQQASLYLSTAKDESFGLTYLEAMRHRLPVIATRSPIGARFLLADGRGVLTEDSVQSVTSALRQTMSEVEAGGKGLIEQGDLNVEYIQSFCAETVGQAWKQKIERLCSGPPLWQRLKGVR